MPVIPEDRSVAGSIINFAEPKAIMQHQRPLSLSRANASLTYVQAGSGSAPLLLFHGFGQTHHAFEPLLEVLGQRYQLYLFDLFFHGNSTWTMGEQPLEKDEWKNWMEQFFQQHGIDKFSVLGFSMGGKFAMATLEAFPDRVSDIILLAPDGIKTSFWYSLATYPVALRKLFKSLIDHPERFHTIAHTAHRLGLIDSGVLRFVEYQMNTEEKRSRVYYAWVVFRHLQFDLRKIAQLMQTHSVHLTLLVGRYDKIITANNMQRLLRLVPFARFEVLEAGHNDLIEKSRDYFSRVPEKLTYRP